jgi:hypothetical protein
MSPPPPSSGAMPAPAPWMEVLARVERRLSTRAGRREGSSAAAAAAVVARAHSRLLIAVDGRFRTAPQLVSELVEDAADLIGAVARLGSRAHESRRWLVTQLRASLDAHEDAVLSAEVAYRIQAADAEGPAARARRATAGAADGEVISTGNLASLRVAAIELASLLIRAATNVTVTGSAAAAPDLPPRELGRLLLAITVELAARAREVERPAREGADVAGHHLAAALRVPAPRETMEKLGAVAAGAPVDPRILGDGRAMWLVLATHEYVAVSVLDGQLDKPAYAQRAPSLAEAIVDAAANVVCGARLTRRPSAFRHDRAWRHQTVGLSYALEAYVAGLRGDRVSLAQTQLITLTRLARSVAAIAVLDLTRADAEQHAY